MIPLEVIPHGSYCYSWLVPPSVDEHGKHIRGKIKPCPYHEIRDDKPEQQGGYCSYLKKGDWEEGGTFLLWDMVKECDVNLENPDEEELFQE